MYKINFTRLSRRLLFWGCLILILGVSCVPVKEKKYEFRNTVDSTVARIFIFQNKQLTDSLIPYMSSPDPTYRYYAARAFQSFTDLRARDTLISLLSDNNIKVATAAAYALGQFRDPSVVSDLIEHFDSNDSLGIKKRFNMTILEAVGKTGSWDELNLLAGVTTYRTTDTALYMGLMRSFLHFQIRDIFSRSAWKFVKATLVNSNIPEAVRRIACDIALRYNYVNFEGELTTMKRLIRTAHSEDLKMLYIKLTGTIRNKDALDYLKGILNTSNKTSVRATVLLALRNYPYASIKSILYKYLNDDSQQLRNIALKMLLEKGSDTDALEYKTMISKADTPFVKAKLYRIVMRHLPFYYVITKRTLTNDILNFIDKASNPYVKAELFRALSEDVSNYKILIEKGLDNEEAIIRTASANGLLRILQSENLDVLYRLNTEEVKKSIYNALKVAIATRPDDGMIYRVIQTASDIDFSELEEALRMARKKLKLPESWETYVAISEKLNLDIPTREQYIDDLSVQEILAMKDSIEIVISTEFGNFTVELYPQIAPFTVHKIISLIKEGYYKKKYFHRVDPQYVIQSGCMRGDGYGGLDFLLRTETPQIYYDEGGYIGMASAGRDTESSQWFITYRATPHLNGSYTIFGKVISGLNNIQRAYVGAQINFIKVKK